MNVLLLTAALTAAGNWGLVEAGGPTKVISGFNSSTTPLSGGATFTGTAEDVTEYASISVFVATDAAGTLFVEFSQNGTDWDRSKAIDIEPTIGHGSVHLFTVAYHFYRVRLVNGASAQTFLRLETILNRRKTGFLTTAGNEAISRINDVQLVRPTTDFSFDISRGLHADKFGVRKFGANGDVGNGVTEFVWDGPTTTYPWPTAAETVRIKAGGDANDTAAGTGAREVTIVGLDENWDLAEEAVATAGASASAATTTTFIRVFRAYVSAAGAYGGANTGNIQIENTSTLDVLAYISAGLGQTQFGAYTIPRDCTGYLSRYDVEVAANKPARVRLWQRGDANVTSAPTGPVRLIHQDLELSGHKDLQFVGLTSYPAYTDIYATATGQGAATAVSLEFDLWVVCGGAPTVPQ